MYDDNPELDDDLISLDQDESELNITHDPLNGLSTDDNTLSPEDTVGADLVGQENLNDPSDETIPFSLDNQELDDISNLDNRNIQYINLNEDHYDDGDLVEEQFDTDNHHLDDTELESSTEWLDVSLESALHHDLGFASSESQISFGGYYNNDGTYHWSSTGENTDSKGNVLYHS